MSILILIKSKLTEIIKYSAQALFEQPNIFINVNVVLILSSTKIVDIFMNNSIIIKLNIIRLLFKVGLS